ncbi:hypothetical protein EON63_06830 [archaeon]|nr:MAG: hypothetical protein EON63_06830 [archaeon]
MGVEVRCRLPNPKRIQMTEHVCSIYIYARHSWIPINISTHTHTQTHTYTYILFIENKHTHSYTYKFCVRVEN